MNRRYSIIHDRTNSASNDYIHLNSCGFSGGADPAFVTYRPSGRVDWHILYQVSGEFTAEYNGESVTVTPGDMLIYPPSVPHLYEYNKDSRTFWLHFSGTAAESVMTSLGMASGIRRGSPDSLITEAFRHLNGLSGQDAASVTVQNGALLTLLGLLARSSAGERANYGENLAPAIRLMREEYSRNISVGECAAICHMSESGFIHQFSESLGVSPHKFLTDIRMEKASDLLLHTNLSISEISSLCGYADRLYFSRVFRKELGASPSSWRKER